MLLSMWHIADALAAHDTVVDIKDGAARLEGVRFIVAEARSRYDLRYAYLYPDENPDGDCESVFISSGNDIVEVRSSSANEVLNEVLEVFDWHNRWETSLWEAASKGSLQDLVDKGYQMLLNPIVLADANGHVRAMTSAHHALDMNAYWVEARETGTIPAAILVAPRFTEAGRPAQWAHNPNIFVLEDGTRTIGATLKQSGQRIGGIAVWEYANPITHSHLDDMRVLCAVIESTHALSLSTESPRAVGAILSDLLDGKEINANLLRELNVGVPSPWMLAAIWAPSQNAEYYARNLVNRFLQSGIACIPFAYRDSVCVLASSETCLNFVRKTLGAEAFDMFASVTSLPFDDLTRIKSQFLLMRYAREHAANNADHMLAQDYAMSYMISALHDALPIEDLAHPALAALARHDAESGNDLFHTLLVFLENEQNAVRSAKALGIHRNSLAARLEKIRHITHIDLENPDERLYLWLSYRLLG